MSVTRPSWDAYFSQIARTVSERSTCLRRQVGAVFVRDKTILSTGYNGSIVGLAHCLDAGCDIVDTLDDGRPIQHCVTGDTVISKFQTGRYNSQHLTMKELFDGWYHQSGRIRNLFKKVKVRAVTSSGVVIPASISDIWESGVAEVYEIRTFLGRCMKATADHRLLTNVGWKSIRDLQIGDRVGLNGLVLDDQWLVERYTSGMTQELLAHEVGVSRSSIRSQLLSLGIPLRARHFGGWSRGLTHGGSAVYLGGYATPSALRMGSRRYAPTGACVVCGDGRALQVHYMDGDCRNDSLENLTTLCVSCHTVAHTPRSKVSVVKYDRIVAIEPRGSEMTYDITVPNYHCYVSNGFISHNCVSTIHAEVNAIIMAAKHGMRLNKSTLYVTTCPCWACFKAVANLGCKRIVYAEDYKQDRRMIEASLKIGMKLEKIRSWNGQA